MSIRFFIKLFIVGPLLAGCSGSDNNAHLIKNMNSSDKFLVDTAKDMRRELIRPYEKQLDLDSINNGFDSVQIRIWYGCVVDGNERLVILSNKKGSWNAEISSISHNYPENSDKCDSLSRTIIIKVPVSGWKKFITELFSHNILTLPDDANVAGINQGDFTDGCGVAVEVATKNAYRSYNYSNPDYYKEIEEARNITQILKLIDKEFTLEQKWGYTNEDTLHTDEPVKIQEIQLQDIKPEKKKNKK